METKYYQIDEVAKLADTTKRTIRYYEDLGLLKPARTDASYRLYKDEDVATIREILNLRSKLGMNLSEIQRFMGLKKSINEILDGSVSLIPFPTAVPYLKPVGAVGYVRDCLADGGFIGIITIKIAEIGS
jgi:hypothetical protein